MKPIIAIATDLQGLMPTETLIKSIAYHNSNLTICVINDALPQEWFVNLRNRLKPLNISLRDVKIDPRQIANEKISIGNITKMTYARFMIPQAIPESRVLYLDNDTIVLTDLHDIFNVDMQGHAIGVVKESLSEDFNAGVMLMDNDQLRQTDFTESSLQQGQEMHSRNDQSILNSRFGNDYYPLPYAYNVQVGEELNSQLGHEAGESQAPDLYHIYQQRIADSKPFKILHFTTALKPWRLIITNNYRNIWWFYHNLELSDILDHHRIEALRHPQERPSLFTMTTSDALIHLDELAEALPMVDFNIAALNLFDDLTLTHASHPNIHFFPNISRNNYQHFLEHSLAYLDINPGFKAMTEINSFNDHGKQFLAFDTSQVKELADQPNYHIFAESDVTGMVNKIKELLKQ